MAENYIPNLTKLAKENTHFSSKNNLQGATEVDGTTFTMASMVAQTSGVPFIVPIGDNSYGDFIEFMPGVTTMDMYPTIMASLGCKIEGERLGIGTNLYSGVPTLMEVMGKDKFMEEISKNSILYNKDILEVE